ELDRDRQRLVTTREDIRVGKLSGAVGTHATVDPRVEESSLKKLGLRVAPVTTQVIARDRHAAYLTTLAVLAGGLEKFATDIRHLQRSEVSEVREPFGAEQKGSSAMPHKRNPVLSERICGLARVVRGYAQTSMENQALWHERVPADELAELFDPAFYLRHLDVTFERLGLEKAVASPSPARGGGQGGGR